MDPGESQEPRVSSALVVDQMQIMREIHGADVVARACAALSPPLAEELAALTTAGFCSLDLARELKNGVAAAVGMDPLAFQRDICARGVDRTSTPCGASSCGASATTASRSASRSCIRAASTAGG